MTTIAQVERIYAARHRQQPYKPTPSARVIKCTSCGKIKVKINVWIFAPWPWGCERERTENDVCPACREKSFNLYHKKEETLCINPITAIDLYA